MEFCWEYPVFIIPHGGGYASVVEPSPDDDPEEPAQFLVIYTEEEDAFGFMQRFQILGRARALQNARELRWLLESLRAPVHDVAFDPNPSGAGVNAAWTVAVQTMLEEHLTADLSPWNYPVYVIAREHGFVSIGGEGRHGEPLTAIGVFTSKQRAESYLQETRDAGTLCKLNDFDETRRFLEAIADQIGAVALDPIVEQQRHTSKYCFPMETLLDKYLVVDKDADRERPADS